MTVAFGTACPVFPFTTWICNVVVILSVTGAKPGGNGTSWLLNPFPPPQPSATDTSPAKRRNTNIEPLLMKFMVGCVMPIAVIL